MKVKKIVTVYVIIKNCIFIDVEKHATKSFFPL